MWRSVRLVVPKSNVSLQTSRSQRFYATSSPSSGGSGKFIVGIIATAGLGITGAVVYGKYDPKFKALLEDNIPYASNVYKLLPDWGQKTSVSPKESPLAEQKIKESAMEASLLKKKQDRLRQSLAQEQKPAAEPVTKQSTTVKSRESKVLDESTSVAKAEAVDHKPENAIQMDIITALPFVNENLLKDMIQKLETSSQNTVSAHKAAVEAVQDHTKKLYDALDVPEGTESDQVWKEANNASSYKNTTLNQATQRAAETMSLIDKLNIEIKKGQEKDEKNPILKSGEEIVTKTLQRLQDSEAEVSAAQLEAKTAAEYKELINKSKEQFRRELQIVLPKYLHGDKDKMVTEDELNLLIAHAHRRIEQLQKQLAKQQVTEKLRVEQAVHQQKASDEKMSDSRIEVEMMRRKRDLEDSLHTRVATLKDEFEVELRQQLRRQAAAHADHLQEVLKVQRQELDRSHSLELEENLLHQKGIFISEVSGNMARLKGILAYMKAKSEFDKASRKAQALWLACQAMNHTISIGKSGDPCPLAKDVAALKIAADDDSEFVSVVLSGLPQEAVTRGVYTDESLKQRFQNVKKVCRRVAIIDENGGSLYKYFLSYLQSLLVLDAVSIPKAELEGKVAVDPSEWDTYDILSRVSYCLKHDDMEQALRYANQLKGEPKIVAKDWMNEVRLLLETKLAVKALLAHAAAVGVQAYH